MEGPPKPIGKIQNQENFDPEFSKWGMEYAMFNLYGWTYKDYHT
jgi:hypothetical protein